MILQLSLFFLSLLPPAISSIPVPKSGCPDWCGNLTIQFPFGVGSDCSLNPDFNITCNTSTHPPKPYLSTFDYLEIVEIKESQIRIHFPDLLSLACYNESGDYVNGSADGWSGFSFRGTPYTFSDDNWLTAIGCDDLVLGIGLDNTSFGGGCVAYCKNVSDSGNGGGVVFCPENDVGYSSGNGCCRTTIPKGLSRLGAQLTNLGTKWRERKLYKCSYAFAQEKETPNQSNFSYPLSYLNNPHAFLDDNRRWKTPATPVVQLDWRINGAENCRQAEQNRSSYACRENCRQAEQNRSSYACRDKNGDCVDFDANVGGYRCNCKTGYIGNPYIPDGCQDIDECADPKTDPCSSNSICINTKGSFQCSCRKGYYGDGMKNKRGCIHLRMINIIIGVGSGLGFILLVSSCVLLRKVLQKRRNKLRKEKFFKQNGGFLLQQRTNEGMMGRSAHLFLAEELEKATDNFNKCRVLGQGGQGIVYRGMLSNGKIVAVKKSNLVDKEQLGQFINEIVILSQINHRNVVKLLGCCLETEVPLLVYEYMPNGTLSNLIHDPKTEFPISWNMRLKIATDIAGALAYMHSASSASIYHRDIKSSNILLDEKYVVKVSDFGISRSVAVDQTHLTTQVKGTFGYFDPEYFQSNQFTEKSDVYSFGVVLVELMTGKKPISSDRDEEEKSLVTRFLTSIEENNVDGMLDPQVLEHGGKDEVSAVVLLTRRYLNLQGKLRPAMKEVATELESLTFSQVPTCVKHESRNTSVHEAKSMMTSDLEYTWTASDISEIPSSSDIHPLFSKIV